MAGHRAFQLYAHITWHTWRRIGCVNDNAATEIRSSILDAAECSGVEIIRGAVLADHVHLLVSFKPSTRLSDFVSQAKGGSAFRANQRVPGSVKWARGYFARSVGKRELEVVKRYIARQFLRHPDLIPRVSGHLIPASEASLLPDPAL